MPYGAPISSYGGLTGLSSVTYQSTVKFVAEAVNQLNTRTTSVYKRKSKQTATLTFSLSQNNQVMLLGACVKPQPLNYLLCTTKLRVFTTIYIYIWFGD